MLYRDRRDRMVFGFTTTYTIGAISTKDVSSNPAHEKMYSLTPLSKIFQSVLLVEEIGVPGESHRPVADH
jgi:hypothetical protein